MSPKNRTDKLEKTIGHLFYATSSFMHYFVAISIKPTKRATWSKTGVIRVQIVDALAHVTLNIDGWRWKQYDTFSTQLEIFLHHFVAICEFKLKLPSGNAQIGAQFVLNSMTLTFDLWPWPLPWTSLSSMVISPENLMMSECYLNFQYLITA